MYLVSISSFSLNAGTVVAGPSVPFWQLEELMYKILDPAFWVAYKIFIYVNLPYISFYILLYVFPRISCKLYKNTSVHNRGNVVWGYISILVVDPWAFRRSASIVQTVLSHSFHISWLVIRPWRNSVQPMWLLRAPSATRVKLQFNRT